MLKKSGLDSAVLSNFGPVSELTFLSKILEHIVFTQQKNFLDEHKILEVFQSGFKTHHSTESPLLRVFNYILLAAASGDCVLLVLVDLAAFDTADHEILISSLEQWVGITGGALQAYVLPLS